ncbi:portal protein [Leifsonia sp. Root4]|uniref:flavin-containing monooxygenase n=1 Tax=Leifsonia sp. Root4 TaxID=1736525 RepID=UPI0006F4F63A|nr:NAD(P)-binding domain-containing protein [Leifsonia sp. Root4]KQW04729.1 portal protein [Leifsonia sp. Root4]
MNATRSADVTTVDTVVIGGGQAGLAIGYFLAKQGRDFVILDTHERIGDAWRLRWDSLRLFTPAKYDGLPGMRFPGDRLGFPTKDEVADYLESYAARFQLPVQTGVRVDRVRFEDGCFIATADGHRWESNNVVLTTGGQHAPKVPEFAARLAPDIVQLHSSGYRNPAQLPTGPTLVVGVGNSGAEIARELIQTLPTSLAGKAAGELPIHHGRAAARFALPVVRFLGLHVLTLRTPLGRQALATLGVHADPLIRTKVRDLADAGVSLVPRVTGVRDGRPVLADGRVCEVSSVIWCTGYRNEFDWVEVPAFDEEGRPRHHRGVVRSVPGLYVLGQELLFAAVSATLPGIGRDAAYLARQLAAGARSPEHRRVAARESQWA